MVGREGGWGEERRRSRSSCQTHGPASGPSPRSGQPGWPGPSLSTAPARSRSAKTAALRLRGSALSCQPPHGGSDDRAGLWNEAARVLGRRRAQGSSRLPRGTPCNRLLPKVLEHTSTPVRGSLNPLGSTQESSLRKGQLAAPPRTAALAVHPPTGCSGAERHGEGGGRRSWTTPGARERGLDPASGLGKDLQELRGSRQGGACLKGSTHPWARGRGHIESSQSALADMQVWQLGRSSCQAVVRVVFCVT